MASTRWISLALLLAGAGPMQDAVDRSPHAVALTTDGRHALTANATSDSVSLVDLGEGKVLAEVPVGKRPVDVALSAGRAIVSNHRSGSITVLDVDPPKLTVTGTVAVGYEPRGVAIDGGRAFVALAGEDAVAVVDLKTMTVTARIPVGEEPWSVAVAGGRLAVACTRSLDVRVFDAETLEKTATVRMRGRNLRRLASSPDGAWAYVCNVSERGFPTTKENIDRGWIVATRLSRVPLKEEGMREAIALDTRGAAVGDAEGVAVSPDGQTIAVAAGGSQELLLLKQPLPFVTGPGDTIDGALRRDKERFRRVPIEGRPMAAAFAPDGKSVIVANYLRNALHVVDVEKGAVVRTVDLGRPAKPSLARRGEAIFYDAKRSFGTWYSCHSCHTDGHTNGGLYDTLNDGKYGNVKKVSTLRGIAKTAPYTWHGWQPDLRAGLEHSLVKTMQGPKPTADELDALVAFVSTLDFAPPKPASDEAAVKRGAEVFKAKRCVECHAGPDYTVAKAVDVGLGSAEDAYQGFNPPSLRGVGTRGPWLHDGRARTLEQVIRKHHLPSKLTSEEDPTDAELKDLIEFLKSL